MATAAPVTISAQPGSLNPNLDSRSVVICSLSEVLEQRRFTMDEVVAWAAAIATELASRHQHGHGHGQVSAGSVGIEGAAARLLPGDGQPSSQPQDILGFATLLRQMLANVDAGTDTARAQWTALDRIAATNSHFSSDGNMKKVASALRLLRDTQAVSEASRAARNRRETVPRNPKRFHARTIHVWAFLASAASIAIAGCLTFLKLVR